MYFIECSTRDVIRYRFQYVNLNEFNLLFVYTNTSLGLAEYRLREFPAKSYEPTSVPVQLIDRSIIK